MVSDSDRRDLYVALERELGAGPAATLMALVVPVDWSEIARRSDLIPIRAEIGGLRGEMAELRGEMAELRGEMAELRGEVKAEIAELRGEVKAEIAEMRGEIAALNTRVDAQVSKIVLTNLPVTFAAVGLVLAGAKLL